MQPAATNPDDMLPVLATAMKQVPGYWVFNAYAEAANDETDRAGCEPLQRAEPLLHRPTASEPSDPGAGVECGDRREL